MRKQFLAALATAITVGITVAAAAPGYAQDRGNREHNRDRVERYAQQDRNGSRHHEPKITLKFQDDSFRLSFGDRAAKQFRKHKRPHYFAPKRHRADYRNYRQWRKAQARRARHNARHDFRRGTRWGSRQDHRYDRYDRHDRRWNGQHHRHG